jgi:hypothetical protein
MRQHVHVIANAGVKPDGIARQSAAPMQTQAHAPPVGALDFDFTSLPAQAPIRIQPKLTIGQTDDPLEREADRAADDAMRMPDGASPIKASAASHGSAAHGIPAPAAVHSVLASSGQPLDAGVRTFFEPRFGHDFSDVRVHSDSAASDSARQAHALAYTAGSHVVFRSDRYQPHTAAGRQLIGHELAHVAQHARGTAPANVHRQHDGTDPEMQKKLLMFRLRAQYEARQNPAVSSGPIEQKKGPIKFPEQPSRFDASKFRRLDFNDKPLKPLTFGNTAFTFDNGISETDKFFQNRYNPQSVNPNAMPQPTVGEADKRYEFKSSLAYDPLSKETTPGAGFKLKLGDTKVGAYFNKNLNKRDKEFGATLDWEFGSSKQDKEREKLEKQKKAEEENGN